MRSLLSRMQGHEFLMRSVVLVLEYHYLPSQRANDSLNNVYNSSSANHISTEFPKNILPAALRVIFTSKSNFVDNLKAVKTMFLSENE